MSWEKSHCLVDWENEETDVAKKSATRIKLIRFFIKN